MDQDDYSTSPAEQKTVWLDGEVARLVSDNLGLRQQIEACNQRDVFFSRAILVLLKHMVVPTGDTPGALEAQQMAAMIYEQYPEWGALDIQKEAEYQERTKLNRFLGRRN